MRVPTLDDRKNIINTKFLQNIIGGSADVQSLLSGFIRVRSAL
jgi:hypothetical protein